MRSGVQIPASTLQSWASGTAFNPSPGEGRDGRSPGLAYSQPSWESESPRFRERSVDVGPTLQITNATTTMHQISPECQDTNMMMFLTTLCPFAHLNLWLPQQQQQLEILSANENLFLPDSKGFIVYWTCWLACTCEDSVPKSQTSWRVSCVLRTPEGWRKNMNRGLGAEVHVQIDPSKALHKLPWYTVEMEAKEGLKPIRASLIEKGLLTGPCMVLAVPSSLV